MSNTNTNDEYRPYKPCAIQFSVSDPTQFDFIISQLDGLSFWAYIFHDKDIYGPDDYPVKQGSASVGDVKPRHLHVYAVDSPKTYKSWGNRFNLPDFMIEYQRNRKSSLLYLTHESKSAIKEGKIKYSRKEVVCSDSIKYQQIITMGDVPDYNQEFDDFWALYKGKISIKQYLQNHPDLLATTAYTRLRTFQILTQIFNNYK